MSTFHDNPTKPLNRPTSRSNSTRSRKHSAPVQIHALLGMTSADGTSRKHGQGHRRGASLSASATVSPTPVDRPTVANKTTTIPVSRLDSDVSNKTSNNTHFASPSSSSSPLQHTRQRSHSYASAPLSTLLTHLESPSLASFTLADPHPCAAGSLRRCQWMMEMNASGHWYTNEDEDDDESANDNHHHHHVVQHNKNVDNKKTTLSTTSSPSVPKRKRMLALPLRLWKKNNHKWDSESDSHADVEDDGTYCEESDSDGADDTPSLTPHSSRRSSRSRSSADRSPISLTSSSPPSGSRTRTTIPPISRQHSDKSSPPPPPLLPLVTGLTGTKPAPSNGKAVRHNGDAKVASTTTTTGSSSDKKVFKQDPGTALQSYKETPITPPKPSLTVKTQTQNMQTLTEPIASSSSSLSRTLRSSKNRRITSSLLPSNNNNNNQIHASIPFPVNPPLSPPTSPRPALNPNPNPPVLLTLSDLERTSKLMRSTTTCAVCGRSGSDFPRCPRTGVAWCSRACRIASKKSANP